MAERRDPPRKSPKLGDFFCPIYQPALLCFAHNTKGVSRIADKRKNGLACPFCPFGGAISKIFEHF